MRASGLFCDGTVSLGGDLEYGKWKYRNKVFGNRIKSRMQLKLGTVNYHIDSFIPRNMPSWESYQHPL